MKTGDRAEPPGPGDRPDQPGQAVFKAIRSEDVEWKPFGAFRSLDPERLEAYPPGAVLVLPGDTPHFHWARSGDYVTQVSAIGPLVLEYVDPKDDPRLSTGASSNN